jgi:hypothetical protein
MESDNIELEINKDVPPPEKDLDPPPSEQVGDTKKEGEKKEGEEEDEFDFGEAVYDEEKYGGSITIEKKIMSFLLFFFFW